MTSKSSSPPSPLYDFDAIMMHLYTLEDYLILNYHSNMLDTYEVERDAKKRAVYIYPSKSKRENTIFDRIIVRDDLKNSFPNSDTVSVSQCFWNIIRDINFDKYVLDNFLATGNMAKIQNKPPWEHEIVNDYAIYRPPPELHDPSVRIKYDVISVRGVLKTHFPKIKYIYVPDFYWKYALRERKTFKAHETKDLASAVHVTQMKHDEKKSKHQSTIIPPPPPPPLPFSSSSSSSSASSMFRVTAKPSNLGQKIADALPPPPLPPPPPISPASLFNHLTASSKADRTPLARSAQQSQYKKEKDVKSEQEEEDEVVVITKKKHKKIATLEDEDVIEAKITTTTAATNDNDVKSSDDHMFRSKEPEDFYNSKEDVKDNQEVEEDVEEFTDTAVSTNNTKNTPGTPTNNRRVYQYFDTSCIKLQGMRSTNQDRSISVSLMNGWYYWGVFDGHGESDFVAEYLKDNLHLYLSAALRDHRLDQKRPYNTNLVKQIVTEVYKRMDNVIMREMIKRDMSLGSGSTATVVLLDQTYNYMYFINLGDSRTIAFTNVDASDGPSSSSSSSSSIGRNNNKTRKRKSTLVVNTVDHNAIQEKPRLVQNPKVAVFRATKDPSSFYIQYDKANGAIQVSRSFGDYTFKVIDEKSNTVVTDEKKCGPLLNIPVIQVIQLQDYLINNLDQIHIIMASDGLWGLKGITNETVTKRVGDFVSSQYHNITQSSESFMSDDFLDNVKDGFHLDPYDGAIHLRKEDDDDETEDDEDPNSDEAFQRKHMLNAVFAKELAGRLPDNITIYHFGIVMHKL
jgi:serine/threonine protein phosphatase PrpC